MNLDASFFPFFELYKLCRTAIRYDLQDYFRYVLVARPVFKFMSYYTRPHDFLPEAASERMVMAALELNDAYQAFVRFSAAYPDFIGYDLSDLLMEMPKCVISYTPAEFNEVLSADFPGVSDSFFDGVTPKFVNSFRRRDTFDRQMGAMQWIFDRSIKNGWSQDSFERLENFVRLFHDADMRVVGSALETYKRNFADSDFIFIPEVDWARTSKHILTLVPYAGRTFYPMVKSTEALAKTAVEMILRDGFFTVFTEANLEMTSDGQIIIPGSLYNVKLTQRQRVTVSEIFKASVEHNYEGVASALVKAGMVGNKVSPRTLSQFCEKMYKENQNFSLAKRYGLALADLGRRGILFPVELRMLYLCLASVEKLCEDEDIWDCVSELAQFYLSAGEHTPTEQTDTVKELVQNVIAVPETAAGLQEVSTARTAPFVDNPDLIPKMIAENQKAADALHAD